jgi:ABC-type glycerol-3-phosphate transport system substrate-binding protein
MKAVLFISLVAALVAAGCGQDSGKSGAGTNSSSISGNPVDAPADYLRAVVKGQEAAVKTVDTASLTRAIQMFNVEEGRNPKDLNELVEKKYLPKLPAVPSGMKLVYDAQAGTVKVVRQ